MPFSPNGLGFVFRWVASLAVVAIAVPIAESADPESGQHAEHETGIEFSIRSVRDGDWSNPKTWAPERVPQAGDRVLIHRETHVVYDAAGEDVIRLVQVVGRLEFARDRDTVLNVGILKVQDSDTCSEGGFACDLADVGLVGEPDGLPPGPMPTLEIGTLDEPIPPQYSARIRLHFLEGMNPDDAPALVCCSARMEIHGAPMSRTWIKLDADAGAGDSIVRLSEAPTGWRVGDEIIVTSSQQPNRQTTLRNHPEAVATEERRIMAIDGSTVSLDEPLRNRHQGLGEYRSEVANLSRNVVVESADPNGVRGHTLYHRFSRGGISYARFAHLGKEGVLGRYAIHFHLIGDTMRGAGVLGAAIVDSHNRWITIHGTHYLVVRDCVGYRSVGHGYYLEDGSEVYNLLDRNLGVQAYRGRPLPKQALPFDPNDGGAFWWANGRNTLVRNVAAENDEYGYRYDSQHRSNFDSSLPIRMPDGHEVKTDIRVLPIFRFSDNESHSEGLYSMAFAGVDGAGPDTRHPHRLRRLKMWETHYALRTELPTMLVEDVRIHRAAYGVYRPWFENHVYRDLLIGAAVTEPFNRGMDDESVQYGPITVDGLTFSELGYGGQMPLIQISDDNPTGNAESHFRNVAVLDRTQDDRWPIVNLGGGPRPDPSTAKGVPVFLHDYYGPGRHAKVVSSRAADLVGDGSRYRAEPPLTGDESLVAEVEGFEFPQLLDPVDDQPPATVVTSVRRLDGAILVEGVSHDDGEIASVIVNGLPATLVSACEGVADWRIETVPAVGLRIEAYATDHAGNVELTPHQFDVDG